MNVVHDTYKAEHFYLYIWGTFNGIMLQRYDTLLSFVKNFENE